MDIASVTELAGSEMEGHVNSSKLWYVRASTTWSQCGPERQASPRTNRSNVAIAEHGGSITISYVQKVVILCESNRTICAHTLHRGLKAAMGAFRSAEPSVCGCHAHQVSAL